MTIRSGDKFLVESVDQFQNFLDVGEEEICRSLPDDKQNALLENYNELAEKLKDDSVDAPQVEAVGDLPEWAVDDWYEYVDISPNNLIIDVLESRDKEYIHLYDGTIHTIVELHPPEE